jgi:predicted AlkP superfamily phosphohydrolase/phosphomutase
MTPHRSRVLFVGLDAMDPDLILQWAKAGTLPTFRSLFERAAYGPTENPPGLFVGAVWPSFFTGASPTSHGRYCYEQIVSGTYDVRRFYASDLKRPPFWASLSDAGRRVAVVDVPKSPLTPNLNGVQLRDWGTHDPDPGSDFATWPPSLAADVIARLGPDPVGDCNDIGRSVEAFDAFRRCLRTRIERKTSLCGEMLEREAWDLFLAVFAESHCVGHQCWVLHDRAHLDHDEAFARVVGDPVEDVYVALDTALGELLRGVGSDTTVFVLASHGMGPHYDATFMLDEILQRLDPHSRMWMQKPIEWGRRGARAVRHRIKKGRPEPRRLPVARRRFFAIPNNDVYGGVRVNLVGREPHGRVREGRELELLFAELRRELLSLVNVDTGRPVVRDVFRLADRYPGECLGDLPDFCVEWNRESPISAVSSPTIGVVRKRFRGVRTGDHKAPGFFWCTGPGIRAGRRADAVSVMDFAPTVGALLDVPLANVDGRPITELLGGEQERTG